MGGDIWFPFECITAHYQPLTGVCFSAERSINNPKHMDCQKKKKRDDCFITFFIAATRDMKTERCRYTAGDRLLRRRKLVSAVEGRKSQEVNQLCDTTGSSGMESALDEVWWLLIRTSSGSWMDKPSSRANWLPLALSPSFRVHSRLEPNAVTAWRKEKKKKKKKGIKNPCLATEGVICQCSIETF